MTTISVNLSDDRLQELQRLAKELNVTVADLVRVSVEELLAQPKEDFLAVAEQTLEKNAELYRRLS